MKKFLFLGLFAAGLLLGACRNNASQGSHEPHQHTPGDTTHQEHGTPADTMHQVEGHEHAPGDTAHEH
ncbi:MAG: hypothetical protein IPH04_05700 [Saprospirales bacterium]|nr:hypothetical protein [Saprospirales bacterium]MBK7335004.1 hypothetical protein [Saprospirales bacterium]